MNRSKRTRQQGFTLVELLVVIMIMLLLASIVYPLISSFQRSSKVDAAASMVAAGVASARGYANRPSADLDPEIVEVEFSGVGLLFIGSEMRLIENDQRAKSTGNNYLESLKDKRNGFRDIPGTKNLYLPKGTGVAGIYRTGSGLELVPPPFAILFDKHGRLVLGRPSDPDSNDRVVYFDGDYDGKIDVNNTRVGFKVREYSRAIGTFDEKHVHDNGQLKLPFDVIETVIGVVVYSDSEFRDIRQEMPETRYVKFTFNGKPLTCQDKNDGRVAGWLFDNGRVLLFSRYTGAPVRERSLD